MAIYYDRDITTYVDGDLVVNEAGDLEVAESTDTAEQLLKTVVATDPSDYDVLPSFGANLGVLVGRKMDEVLQRIPILIRDGLRKADYIDVGDVFIDVYPIDIDKVLIFIDLRGTYINSNGQEVASPSGSIKFYFPYTQERIREWT